MIEILEGKVAVITGSDSCVGLAEPSEFAREDHVVLNYLHDEEGQRPRLRESKTTGSAGGSGIAGGGVSTPFVRVYGGSADRRPVS